MIPLFLALVGCVRESDLEIGADSVSHNPVDDAKCGAAEMSFIPGRDVKEHPVADVCLDQYEKDHSTYENWMQAQTDDYKKPWMDWVAANPEFIGDKKPAVGMTFQEAMAYCTSFEKRLPTQWEWLNGRLGASGQDLSDEFEEGETAVPLGAPGAEDVNASAASSFDLHGMIGNVRERVSDNPELLMDESWVDTSDGLLEALVNENYRLGAVGFRCAKTPE